MSKLLLDVRTLDLHPPTTAPALPAPAPSLADRASLRLGLWLLLRAARRADHRADRDARVRLVETDRRLAKRDHESLLRLHLSQPRA